MWCDTALQPRLGPLDARVVFPVALWFLHWAYWTFYIAVIAIGVLVLLEKAGLPVNAAFRQFKTVLLGRRRPVPAQDVLKLRKRGLW